MHVNVTLQVLASPHSDIGAINGAERCDHVVRLITTVFRLCEIEKNAVAADMTGMLSPELSCTIIWFMQRWSLHYLVPVESNYSEISPTLLEAFGRDSQAAMWTMNYLLEKIARNLNAFSSEPALVTDSVQLLVALVESQQK